MNAYVLANLVCGVSILVFGALLLLSRERVLRVVRRRFEQVHREDDLSDREIERRLPKTTAVVVVGSGFALVGTALIMIGIVSTR
ncbi:hypothetical protein [Microbacterium oxydans]|uniref:hypothetical protein n=1 Tax=Microbacterium oxydans TaxID=82380 RepID=UPI0024ACE2F3|nr:hypothetical protein [Microbacterium oxydans]